MKQVTLNKIEWPMATVLKTDTVKPVDAGIMTELRRSEFETQRTRGDEAENESLFATFADEIDSWARRALAANGFGDCP